LQAPLKSSVPSTLTSSFMLSDWLNCFECRSYYRSGRRHPSSPLSPSLWPVLPCWAHGAWGLGPCPISFTSARAECPGGTQGEKARWQWGTTPHVFCIVRQQLLKRGADKPTVKLHSLQQSLLPGCTPCLPACMYRVGQNAYPCTTYM
jgi:hypothetical protein